MESLWNCLSIACKIVCPDNLWYSLEISANSCGDKVQKYLLKTDSSVPNFFSPALYISWAISAHWAWLGFVFVPLPH